MTEIAEVPSPFCGLGCDDLRVQVEGAAVKVVANGCAVNTPLFEQAVTDTRPRVGGQEASLAEAIDQAAWCLRAARQPLIAGCATDVAGMRALLALADQVGAIVDSAGFSDSRANLLALQDAGWITTTLTEMQNRCDLLLVVGTDLESYAPRFFQRHLWTQAMWLADPGQRRVVYLGAPPSGAASTSPSGVEATVHGCAQADLPEVIAALRALLKGRPLQRRQVGGIAVAELQALAAQLRSARYGVVTWAAAGFGFGHAELAVQMLAELIKDLNQDTRYAGLPLGGKEGGLTAQQVCTWTTGYPARVSFQRGFPEYDPFLFDSQRLLAHGEVDALVWVQAFNAQAAPPPTQAPTVVLGRPGMAFARAPKVYIPVGTPGIDHDGHSYRSDQVVAIRLRKLRDCGLPAAAEVLAAIGQALQARPAG